MKTHNDFRSAVDPAASNMLYMTWDPDLAKTAKGWAKRCQFKHNPYIGHAEVHPRFRSVGENIWIGSVPAFTPRVAITSWKNEDQFYTYDTNRCSEICGHYTQVVWATSYKVGCAVQFCRKIKYSSIRNAAYFICNYGPPGNLPMRPYKTGAECSECGGEQCANKLCQNEERDKVIENSKWHPEWDRPACDAFCISVTVLRSLLLVLTILATWLLPKYWSVVPASG